MNIPKEHLKIIQLAAYKVRRFYKFDIYEIEDIEQEAIIIGMQAYEKWDQKRPLLSFMVTCMKNRLCNLINKHKVDIVKSSIEDEHEGNFSDFIERDTHDILNLVEKLVPLDMRLDFLKMRESIYVPKGRQTEIIEYIQQALIQKKMGHFIQLIYRSFDA